MLLKVNCQGYAYKLSLSNLAPLPLIHRHERKRAQDGAAAAQNQFADALMVFCIITYHVYESLFHSHCQSLVFTFT